jgi:molybdopterin synthase sulfur carrier subunit
MRWLHCPGKSAIIDFMRPNDSPIVTIEVLYFARLREVFGREREQVELPGNVQDVGGLTAWLRSRGDSWERELAPGRPVRIAVNQDMAAADTPVGDGDEVAFFPPVTGG